MKKHNYSLIFGLILTGIILVITIIGQFWTPYDITGMNSMARNQAPSLMHIMGTDNLKDLHTWMEPEKILKYYKVIVLERDGDNLEEIIESEELLRKNKESIIKIKKIILIELK